MGVRKGNTISASEALTGIMPTYEDFALLFLTPVEITDISKKVQRNNTNLALTNTCLSLEPLGDGRGGYRFYNLRTKKIINVTRAANQYTKLTRMDEGIYNAYTDYIYDRAGNTQFDVDSLEVDEHPIDDEYIGRTAFTRAVRYNPVMDVLRPNDDAHTNVTAPTVPDTQVADTGADHTPPAQHAPTNTGATPPPAEMSETGVAPPPNATLATGVDATPTVRRPRKRRQRKQPQSMSSPESPATDGAMGPSTANEAVTPARPYGRAIRRVHFADTTAADTPSSTDDTSIPSAIPAIAPQPNTEPSSTEDAAIADSTEVTGTVDTRSSPYPPRTRKIRSYITAATTSTTSDYQNYVSPWDPLTRKCNFKPIKPHANITGKFAIACATIFIAAATVRAKTKEEAILNELKTILAMGTFKPCRYADIDDASKLVGCSMIHTQKFAS